ncbi:MAG: hypothetical protein U9N34_01820 [Candidatus Cloacimonadota bacterium]|nr:hypothetical protein [Candidatus Cloacimonadota bacterium]
MKRISVIPKQIIEEDFAYGEIVTDEDTRKYIFDVKLIESVDYDFINNFFDIEILPNQEDKSEKAVILHGHTNISFNPRYRPQSRFKKNGPIKTYEGYEYMKEFVRIDTFLKLFEIVEHN